MKYMSTDTPTRQTPREISPTHNAQPNRYLPFPHIRRRVHQHRRTYCASIRLWTLGPTRFTSTWVPLVSGFASRAHTYKIHFATPLNSKLGDICKGKVSTNSAGVEHCGAVQRGVHIQINMFECRRFKTREDK